MGTHALSPLETLAVACRAADVDPGDATLLSHSTNVVYHLPSNGAVARITTGPHASERVRRTHAVTNWLVDQGFPATAPLPGAPVVTLADDACVSFWVYYPQPTAPADQPDSSHLGRLLHQLHQLDTPPAQLPEWIPLESLADTIADHDLSRILTREDRVWITDRITTIRGKLAVTDWPLGTGLIHGDAWAGNLLWDQTSSSRDVVLGDWDWVSIGPREVDLIPTWHATVRYNRPPTWHAQFAAAYGYDLATWSGYDLLLQMRDLVQLTGPIRRAPHSPTALGRLRQRLGDLRRGDRDGEWTSR